VTPGSGRIEFEVVEEAAPRWLLAPEVVATIERRSATELTLAAAHVDEWIRHSADHLAGVLISPREAPRGPGDGGLVFAEVRSGSLFAHLGIEVGDVLLALNGRPVSSLEVAGQEVLTGRERGRLTARLQRRGQAFELELSLPGMPALRGAAQ
jgi:S1-C subfamily serine protease